MGIQDQTEPALALCHMTAFYCHYVLSWISSHHKQEANGRAHTHAQGALAYNRCHPRAAKNKVGEYPERKPCSACCDCVVSTHSLALTQWALHLLIKHGTGKLPSLSPSVWLFSCDCIVTICDSPHLLGGLLQSISWLQCHADNDINVTIVTLVSMM